MPVRHTRRPRPGAALAVLALIATLLVSGATSASAASSTLIITEIDYDQPGTDSAEFVEIYNAARTPATLDGIALVFFNAGTSPAEEYLRVVLSGSLYPGGTATVSSPTLPTRIPGGALDFAFPGDQNQIQNGPDGAALVRLSTKSVIDAIAYEAAIPTARITDGPVVDLGPSIGADDGGLADWSLFRPTMDLDTDTAMDWRLWDSTPGGENCHLFGTTGNDALTDPTSVANVICGGPGNDALIGLDGGDSLVGGAGTDIMLGGRGDDILDGRSGKDTAGFYDSGVASGVTVDVGAGIAINAQLGTDVFVLSPPVGGLSTVEDVKGSPFADLLIGDAQANGFDAGAGNDVLYGGDGNDLLRGHDGEDELYGEGGDDRLQPGYGDDPVVDGGPGPDMLEYSDLKGTGVGQSVDIGAALSSGFAGNDRFTSIDGVTGSARDDSLTARVGGVASIVIGFYGNDTLNVFDSDTMDTVHGGGGVDICVVNPGESLNTCEEV
ncbi:MAG: lamin tail domain-containing protein [Actinomycetota bacterium]